MSCERMESRILGYVGGQLKESERLEVEKHLAECAPCCLRVNEFSAVSGLLDELPLIEPSPEFDTRVHARVAAEPQPKADWWAWMRVSPRIAFAASMLLLDSARHREPAPALAWWMLGAGVVATLAVNVLAGVPGGVLASIIAAWPAGAFVGCYELLMVLVRAAARRTVADVATVPDAATDVVTVQVPTDAESAALTAIELTVPSSSV